MTMMGLIPPPAAGTAHWLARNVLVERLGRAVGGRYRRWRYEDFVAAPRRHVEELLELAGVSPIGGPFVAHDTVRLGANHTVSGNPSRFRHGDVQLKADDAWRTEQTLRPRLVSTVIASPLLRRYGYGVRQK
jgi:hypothetical protein